MIINIRGTSGSGKSTLVRAVMEQYRSKLNFKREGRKQPIGYVCQHNINGAGTLAVIGHYETDCGGCDTISQMDDIFELVRRAHGEGHHVIFEGLLISADVNRTAALHQEGLPLLVLAIDLPLEECLSSVNGRRREKAERTDREYKGDVNPRNTESKHRGVQRSMERLQALGVSNALHSRDDCLRRIKTELGL